MSIGRRRLNEQQRKQAEDWQRTRVKIINLVARKKEIEKICCICGKEGKILHNKKNPYFITFICDECKKDPQNIEKAEELRFDLRDKLNKDNLCIHNFSDYQIKEIIKDYLKDYCSIGKYCEKLNISRYQFNILLQKYNALYPKENIKQRVKARSKKVQSERLKKSNKERRFLK